MAAREFRVWFLKEKGGPIQRWTIDILDEEHPEIGQREFSMDFLYRHGMTVEGSILNCGSGNDLCAYQRFFPKCSKYRLLDLETPKQWPGNPRDIIIADVQDMPEIPSDSEDCIIAYWFLNLVPNLEAALTEFRRVLKPNGILLASFIGDSVKSNPNVPKRWTHIEALEALEPFFEVDEVDLYCEPRGAWTEGRFIMGATAIGWQSLKLTLVRAQIKNGFC